MFYFYYIWNENLIREYKMMQENIKYKLGKVYAVYVKLDALRWVYIKVSDA